MLKLTNNQFIFYKKNSLISFINSSDRKSVYLDIRRRYFLYIVKEVKLSNLFY